MNEEEEGLPRASGEPPLGLLSDGDGDSDSDDDDDDDDGDIALDHAVKFVLEIGYAVPSISRSEGHMDLSKTRISTLFPSLDASFTGLPAIHSCSNPVENPSRRNSVVCAIKLFDKLSLSRVAGKVGKFLSILKDRSRDLRLEQRIIFAASDILL